MLILFVCTGNTCRSPLAELYFNDFCRRAGRTDVKSSSAGVCAFNGGTISRESAFILRENGICSDGFRSRAITPGMVNDADLIVVMNNGMIESVGTHGELLQRSFRQHR